MHSTLNRLAAGTFAVLFALASVNVATARADDYLEDYVDGGPTSTTCGAGTVTQCAMKPIITCDFKFKFAFDKIRGIDVEIGFTDCHVTGHVPIYKDRDESSQLSGSCSALSPMLGMPAGSGCSD